MMPAPSVVSVVDTDAGTRRTVARLIEAAGLRPASYASADDLLRSSEADVSGCVISELLLPGSDGLALHRELVSRGDAPPVIIHSAHGDVTTVTQAIREGVFDYIAKPVNAHQLLNRVHAALRLNAAKREQAHRRALAAQRLATLTQREREVLDLIMQGMANKQMAFTLQLTEKAIEARRARIREKMRVDSLIEMLRMVMLARGELAPLTVEAPWTARRYQAAA